MITLSPLCLLDPIPSPKSDLGFGACVSDGRISMASAWPFPLWWLLLHRIRTVWGGASTNFVSSNEMFQGPGETPPGQICGCRGPTGNKTLTEIPFFFFCTLASYHQLYNVYWSDVLSLFWVTVLIQMLCPIFLEQSRFPFPPCTVFWVHGHRPFWGRTGLSWPFLLAMVL